MGTRNNIPFSILRRDFINNLNNLINNSGLEPYMLESILKDSYERMAVATEQQYQRELTIYQKSLQDRQGE